MMAMLKFLLIFALFLPFVCMTNLSEQLHCQGADDGRYYFDDDLLYGAPRCCKCSECTTWRHRRIVTGECDEPNNCIGSRMVCFDEKDFTTAWRPNTTTSTTTRTTTTTSTTGSTMQSTLMQTIISPTELIATKIQLLTIPTVVLIILIVIIVGLLVFIIQVCSNKNTKAKFPCFWLTVGKFKKCIGTDSKQSNIESQDEDIGEMLIIKERGIVSTENGNPPGNHCPASDSSMHHPSSSGPSGMHMRAGDGVTVDCESCSRSEGSVVLDYNIASNSFNHPMVGRPPEPNSRIETNGNNNFVFANITDGGNMNIGNVYVINNPKDGNGFVGITPPAVPSADIAVPPADIAVNSERLSRTQARHEPTEDERDVNHAASTRQTFPTPVSGINYVTSMSPPLTSRGTNSQIPLSSSHPAVRRQSSSMSSTSTGPVENQTHDEECCLANIEDASGACYPQSQHNSQQINSNWSRNPSRSAPVQHPRACTARYFSEEDSSISIATPPEAGSKGLL